MFCPACRDAEMLVIEWRRVEVDYCPECGGVWLDSGELELIGERAGALGDRLRAIAGGSAAGDVRAPARRRPCPVCGKGLKEVCTATEPASRIDKCPAGDGIWFDRGELPAVVRAGGAAAENLLVEFLGSLGAAGKAAGGPQALERE